MLEMKININENIILENDLITFTIYKSTNKVERTGLFILINKNCVSDLFFGCGNDIVNKYENLIFIEFKDNIDVQQFINDFTNDNENSYVDTIKLLLSSFNYDLKQKSVTNKKKTYSFKKAISEMEFTTDYLNTSATIIWQSRNEVLLKKGAILLKDFPLNKDGSKGFSVKMGEQLRSINNDYINDFTTTEDIILKSINEVGLFLYFGGTNSWMQFKNSDGVLIDELCGK